MTTYRSSGEPLPPPTPAARATSRHRLPVEPPTRALLIGSLASVAGGVQLFGWALARLPTFFMVFGVFLVVTGLGFGLAALRQHRRYRWVAHIGPEALMIVSGKRRTVLPWESVGGVRYGDFRLRVTGTDGTELVTLPVDRTRPAHEAAQVVERGIAAHLVAPG